MGKAWIPRTFEEACKRAGGRRRYLATVRDTQHKRRLEILRFIESRQCRYGNGVLLAQALKVSAATISRDIKYWRSFRAKLGHHEKTVIAMLLRRTPD